MNQGSSRDDELEERLRRAGRGAPLESQSDGELKQFYCRAMLLGWVSGRKSRPSIITGYDNIPHRMYCCREGSCWLFEDFYRPREFRIRRIGKICVVKDDTARGLLAYDGWCDNRVVAFLKEVRAAAWEVGTFFGGFGPPRFDNDQYSYTNCYQTVDGVMSGIEQIWSASERRYLSCMDYRWEQPL